jgi:RNA ligase (TIGR02306 family)
MPTIREEIILVEGKDVTELLGIIKYEPQPVQGFSNGLKSKGINYHYKNENFKHYTDIDNIKKNLNEFQSGEEVVATVKFHGSNMRAGFVARLAKSFTTWERIKRAIRLKVDEREELVGSHNTIRKPGKKGTPIEDTFHKVNAKYNLTGIARDISTESFQDKDVILFCELIGKGIQKGYEYGCEEGDFEIRIFDIMIDGSYIDRVMFEHMCALYDLPIADVVYRGPWSLDVLRLAEGIDEYNGKKYVREGIVIKPTSERKDRHNGRAIYKAINPAYLLDKQNSDFH